MYMPIVLFFCIASSFAPPQSKVNLKWNSPLFLFSSLRIYFGDPVHDVHDTTLYRLETLKISLSCCWGPGVVTDLVRFRTPFIPLSTLTPSEVLLPVRSPLCILIIYS